MTTNYLNCLKSYLPLSLHTKTKNFPSPFPFAGLNFSSFFSSQIPTNTANPNDKDSSKKEQTLLFLFKKCFTMRDVEEIHSHVIKLGFHQNLYVVGKIIVFCAVNEGGSMDYAVSVFEKIKNPDGFLWNTMIRGFGRIGQVERVFYYYKSMQEMGEIADNFTFSFLLKVSGQLGLAMVGKQIHCIALKHGLEGHVFVRNTLIHMYGMLKEIGTAYQLFEEIPRSELVAWNTIIDCHVYCGKYKEALELFLRMRQNDLEPDEATLVVTLSACSALGALDYGRWVHSFINHTRFSSTVSVSNSLIDMYAKCGAVEGAYRMFSKMNKRNIVTWNAMILGLAAHGHTNEALTLFLRMLDEKLESPNAVTFLGVLCACSHGGMVEEGRKYFNSMSKDYHIHPTIKHYGCMADILGRAGLVEEAYNLVKNMPMKCNAIVWRTLLAACRVHGSVELGEQVRSHLLELEPDHSSDYVLLANMYASVGEWNDAARVRRVMRDRGVQKPSPGNSFIGITPKIRPTKACYGANNYSNTA